MRGRELPVKEYRELLLITHVAKLSLKDRLKLLLGFNVLLTAEIYTQHVVGKTKQRIKVELTELEKAPPTNLPILQPSL